MKTSVDVPFQLSPNGPLSPEAVSRLKAIKDATGMSYAALGQKVGISGTFLYNLMNKGMNVGTQHIKRMEGAVVRLEAGEEVEPAASRTAKDDVLSHTYHLRPSFQVMIDLPVDLSSKEAERLSMFIQSLPST